MAKRNKDNGHGELEQQARESTAALSEPQPETNGTAATEAAPQPALPPVEPTVTVADRNDAAVLKYQKAPSAVFYAVMGENREGSVDCLAVTKTRGQAEKALATVGMAVKRHYATVNLWKCRPVDAA